MTHDCKRKGTTDLFATMNLATGQVLTHCQEGHTAKDVLVFFKQIDASVPKGLVVHVVMDNLSAQKTPEITKWLSHRDRRRWHLHFTPTSSSWLNLIERWFKELTDKRLRRGVFTNVPELIEVITTWSSHWNDDPKPFIRHRHRRRDHREGTARPDHLKPPDQFNDRALASPRPPLSSPRRPLWPAWVLDDLADRPGWMLTVAIQPLQ
jgi:transposase